MSGKVLISVMARSRLSSRSLSELPSATNGINALKPSNINVPPRRISFAGLYSSKEKSEIDRNQLTAEQLKQRRKENISRLSSLTGIQAFPGFEMDPADQELSPLEKLKKGMTAAKESGYTTAQIFGFFGNVSEKNEISASDFARGIRHVGRKIFEVSDAEVQEMVHFFDIDGDGQITIDEFKAFCYRIPSVAWKAERIRLEAATEDNGEGHKALAKEKKTRGMKAFNLKDYAAAEIYFTEAIDLEKSSELLSLRSACRCGLKMFEKAILDADESIKLDPGQSFGYYRKAQVMAKTNNHVAASQLYEKAGELEPKTAFFQSMAKQERLLARGASLRRIGQVKTVNISTEDKGACTSPNTPNMQRRLLRDGSYKSGIQGVKIYEGSKLFWRSNERVDIFIYIYDENCVAIRGFSASKEKEFPPIFANRTKVIINPKELEEQLEAARQEYIVRESPQDHIVPPQAEKEIQQKVQQASIANFFLLRLVIEPAFSLRKLALDNIEGSLEIEMPTGLDLPFMNVITSADRTEQFESISLGMAKDLNDISQHRQISSEYYERASATVEVFKSMVAKKAVSNKWVREILLGARRMQVKKVRKRLTNLGILQ